MFQAIRKELKLQYAVEHGFEPGCGGRIRSPT
jgi:hypothetical protein